MLNNNGSVPEIGPNESIKSRIGAESSRVMERATLEKINRFGASIGRTPWVSDASSAVRGSRLPPTFLTAHRHAEFELFQQLGIPLANLLHAEQSYQYWVHPFELWPESETTVEVTSKFTQAFEKKSTSGLLRFLTFTTEWKRGHQILSSSKTTVISGSELKFSIGEAKPLPDKPAGFLFETQLGVVTGAHLDEYAKESGDFNPIHLDDSVAKAHGLPGRIAHGMWVIGRMVSEAELFLNSVAAKTVALPEGWPIKPEIVDLQTRFRGLVQLGDTLTLWGYTKNAGLELVCYNQRGEVVNQAHLKLRG